MWRLWGWWRNWSRYSWVHYPLTRFRSGDPCNVSLSPYLERFARPQMRPDPRAYRIALSRGQSFEKRWNRFRDGAYGLILLVNRRAVALVTWNVDEANGVIGISQIQGVQGQADRLSEIRWEKLLLQLAIDWAAAHGYREARLICSGAHPWYNGAAQQSGMRMKYEITGKRMGFRPVPDQKYLSRSLVSA